MKEYRIYTKGLEYGGMVAAYSIDTNNGHVIHGAKKFGYTIDGVEIDENKGHFVMEIIAAWSGLTKVPEGSKVTIFSNDLAAVRKLERKDDDYPYAHFIDWAWREIENKNLDVEFVWVKQGKCDKIDNFVKPLAVSMQRQ